MQERRVPETAVRRLSLYLRFLEEFGRVGKTTVSSQELARRGGTTAAQVRKDLSLFGSFGKRGLGYSVAELTGEIRKILGLGPIWRIALVGAGRIGTALAAYGPFRNRGFEIVAVLDVDPSKVGKLLEGVPVVDESRLEEVIRDQSIDLVILAVPAPAAQALADRIVAAGVGAILNYAPTRLHVPSTVALRNVSMLMELEALSYALSQDPKE